MKSNRIILILGASGYVGRALTKGLRDKGRYVVTFSGLRDFISDRNNFEYTLLRAGITDVVNCGGYTGTQNVDDCENNAKECYYSNVTLPVLTAQMCRSKGINYHHISSGCIYKDLKCADGEPPLTIFTENDPPNFSFDSTAFKSSWYSGTKAMAEKLLSGCNGQPLATSIIRIRIPFSDDPHPRNFISKITNHKVLLNAANSFTYLEELSTAVDSIINMYGNVEFACIYNQISNIYNAVQPGYMTTPQVMEIIQKYAGPRQIKYFANDEEFNRTVLAPRSSCVLSPDKLKTMGVNLTHVYDAFETAVKKFYNK